MLNTYQIEKIKSSTRHEDNQVWVIPFSTGVLVGLIASSNSSTEFVADSASGEVLLRTDRKLFSHDHRAWGFVDLQQHKNIIMGAVVRVGNAVSLRRFAIQNGERVDKGYIPATDVPASLFKDLSGSLQYRRNPETMSLLLSQKKKAEELEVVAVSSAPAYTEKRLTPVQVARSIQERISAVCVAMTGTGKKKARTPARPRNPLNRKPLPFQLDTEWLTDAVFKHLGRRKDAPQYFPRAEVGDIL